MPKITGRVVRAASDADASVRRPRLFDFDEDGEDTLDTQPALEEDDDDDQDSTTGSTSSTSSNDDRIRSLAARIQNRMIQQQGVHVADQIGFEIASRLFRSVANNHDDDEEEDTSGTTEEDETYTTTTSGEDEDATTEIASAEEDLAGDVAHPPSPSQDIAAEETATEEMGTCTETSSTETTEEALPAPAPSTSSGRYCVASHCRNRPAADCTNSLCGRCCILTGTFFCPRHNS